MTKFGSAPVISLVSLTEKVKSDDFDIWPDLKLTFDLFLGKSKNEKHSLGAIVCRLVRLSTATLLQLDREGAESAHPQVGCVRPNAPAGCRLEYELI